MQTPGQPEVEAGEGAGATSLPDHYARTLDRVRRTLRYAVRDDGGWLWKHRWLERICRPALLDLLRDPEGPPHPEALAAAVDLLEGLDDRPWQERLEVLVQVEEALEPAYAELDGFAVEPLRPRGELVELEDEPEPAPAPPQRRAAEPTPPPPAPEPEPEPPPPLPRLRLGHPDGTGAPIEELEGATPQAIAALLGVRVHTIADLLQRAPRAQVDIPVLAEDAVISEDLCAFKGTVVARCLRLRPSGNQVAELVLRRGEQLVRCRWTRGVPWDLVDVLDQEVVIAGRAMLTDDGPVFYEVQRWWPDDRDAVRLPVYGIEGLDEDLARALVREALASIDQQLIDPLPATTLRAARVMELEEALRERHLPTGPDDPARKRDAFQELLVHQLRAAARGPAVRPRGIPLPVSHETTGLLQLQHQITLDDDQEQAFDEIRRDLRRPTAMTRLLQGDVGTGKAMVALMAAAVVAHARSQVLFLAPDGIAAEHRFLFAEPMLRSAGVVTTLVSDEPTPAQLDALRRGETTVVFATHKLAQDGLPAFKKLGLVVVEERAHYGSIRRETLAQKNVNPDLLVVTSVPIPTSLVFTIFGDHDMSVIRSGPRQIVESQVLGPTERERAYERIREEHLEHGRQAMVVFPLVKGRDLLDLRGASQLAQAMEDEAFPGRRVGLYHGSMSREERLRVFEDFQRRRLDVLVSTTTIEDAPELANVTALIVENADRYSLVRLHRLRGMIAHGRMPGLCAMVLSAEPEPEGERLVNLVAREQDGFTIAEQDRVARGDEALLGERAGELPPFVAADPVRDRELLLKARRAAFALLQADPQLRQRPHRELCRMVFGDQPRGDSGDASSKGRRRRRRRRGGRP